MAKKAKQAKKYTVTDGDLVLTLEPDDGWYCVTSPFNPEIITQARTLEEAFEMARDVVRTYKDYRAKKRGPAPGPPRGARRSGKGAVKKTA